MHRRALLSLLLLPALLAHGRADTPKAVGTIRIAVYADAGTSKSRHKLAERLAAAGRFRIEPVKADDIRAGCLGGYDVVIFPGGSGSGEAKSLGDDGRERVREFVRAGGGYVGVCAGAYLATCDYSWSLGLLDAKVLDKKHWARGYGRVDIAVAPKGRDLLGAAGARLNIYYHQGPLLAPAGDDDIPDYELLATFAGDVAKEGVPGGVMPGTTAVAAGRFGSGRVLCFSPHPELTDGPEGLLHRGVAWAAGE